MLCTPRDIHSCAHGLLWLFFFFLISAEACVHFFFLLRTEPIEITMDKMLETESASARSTTLSSTKPPGLRGDRRRVRWSRIQANEASTEFAQGVQAAANVLAGWSAVLAAAEAAEAVATGTGIAPRRDGQSGCVWGSCTTSTGRSGSAGTSTGSSKAAGSSARARALQFMAHASEQWLGSVLAAAAGMQLSVEDDHPPCIFDGCDRQLHVVPGEMVCPYHGAVCRSQQCMVAKTDQSSVAACPVCQVNLRDVSVSLCTTCAAWVGGFCPGCQQPNPPEGRVLCRQCVFKVLAIGGGRRVDCCVSCLRRRPNARRIVCPGCTA